MVVLLRALCCINPQALLHQNFTYKSAACATLQERNSLDSTMAKTPEMPEDGDLTPYNAPQLMAMKEDIANRAFRIKMTGMIVTAIFVVAAVAAMFFMPGLAAGGGKSLLTLGMAAAGGVTSMLTMREAKKLELDESYITSYMQGKNYWGAGYRQEVAEHGYSAPGLALQAPPGPRAKPQHHGMHK
jgi:hypothetical protein